MRQRDGRRRWIVAGMLALAAAAAAMLAAATGAASATKWYVPAISPAAATAGAAVTHTLTFQNSTSSTHPLGAVRATFPAGFTGLGVVTGTLAPPSGKTWVSSVSGGTVELRAATTADALAPGQSVWVQVTVTAPCTPGQYTIVTDAVQDNKFSGPPGNKFQLQKSPPVDHPAVQVAPGSDVDHFELSTIDDDAVPGTAPYAVTAGDPFPLTITAVDTCGNTATGYNGQVSLSGLAATAPDGTAADYAYAGAGDTTADTSVTLAAGTATTQVRATAAEEDVALSVTDGSDAGSSNTFDVLAGPVADLDFVQQPSDVQVTPAGSSSPHPVTPAVTVRAEDEFENLTSATVSVAIGTNPGGGSLSGGGGVATVDGIASFSNLTINKVGVGYTLVASAGSVTSEASTPFNVLDVLAECDDHDTEPCSGSTGADATASTNTVTTVTAPAGGDDGTLRIVVFDLGGTACGGDGSGLDVTVQPPPGHTDANPVEVIVEYDKKIAPGTGVANFEFCLVKPEPDPDVVIDPLANCKDTNFALPCIAERHRDNAGDLVIRVLLTSEDPFIRR
jgi:hypothetical protein